MDLSSYRDTKEWRAGLALLKLPVWPLINLVEVLCLTGGFEDLEVLLNELPDEIEMEHGVYQDPITLLTPYKDLIIPLLGLESTFSIDIFSGPDKLPEFEAREAYFKQKIIERELESINSHLCAPMGCNICCIGPREEESNLFFEIPLTPDEVPLFDVESLKPHESIGADPYKDPPLMIDNRPFYERTPRIVYWSKGPSLILGRGTACPNLSGDNRCVIYQSRPNTCRRPQIFSYVIDKNQDLQGFVLENKLLAISDCPYVKELKQEIHTYASLSGLDLIIAPNRA